MGRNKSPEERARWAAYMREYRAANRDRIRKTPRGTEPTPRQLEILRLYADPDKGGSQAKVAAELGISVSAVHNQLQALMKRLNVSTPAQAIWRVWVEPDAKGNH